MLDDFLLRAIIAGIGVALAAGPLGCFIVWRRMAYFGDATAHAALLGVAVSLAFSMSIVFGVMLVAVALALALSLLERRGLSPDTVLGVFAPSALAFGVIAISLFGGRAVDLQAYLFGEILAVNWTDIGTIWVGALLILALLMWRWPRLLLATLSTDLAAASGIQARREQLVLSVATALLVAISIKAVGALLIVAMLVIPAATARPLARTPEAMAAGAAGAAILAVIAGLQASLWWGTPTGPSMVASATVLFVLALIAGRLRGS